MPKLLTEKEFNLKKLEITQNSNLEIVSSCNKNNCVSIKTKLIIVGTITPPEGAGYFYTAPRNKIYGYIDSAINTNLKELKKQLLLKPHDSKIIEEIKYTLIKNKIGFLDIIKSAIRKNDSPYDKDIKYYTLDTEVFKTNTTALYICNSKFAEEGFIQICKELNLNLNYLYLSQRHDTKQSWLSAILNALN